jgi:putative MFS transporter
MRDSKAAPSAGEISARIDRLPATRTIWTAILLLSFGMFFELYDLLFSGYIAPSLVHSGLLTRTPGLFEQIQIVVWRLLDLPPPTPSQFAFTGVAGFIAALFTGLFIGTILCGFLADKFGRRTIFAGSLLWYTAANVMVAMQHDAFGLDVWRLISGIGLGLEMVTIGAYLSEMAPKGMRGKAFACSQAIGFCCVPVISFLAYVLVPAAPLGLEGWRWVVLLGAAAAVLIGFLRFALPESPRWLYEA